MPNEYSDLSAEDEKARLDNFAIHLQKDDRQVKGYIIVYAGPGTDAAKAHAQWAKDYLVRVRRIATTRIITIYGGCRDRLEVELYALPVSMSPPTPNPHCNEDTKLLAKRNNAGHGSVKFDEYDLKSVKQVSSRLDQFATTLAGWVGARGYLIVYPGGSVTLAQAELHAEQAKTYLVKKCGIDSDRIVTVIGGFREEPSVELFITVKNGNPPIPLPPSRQGSP